jgi:hypothetical protein
VKLLRIGPGRQASDGVERAQQASDDLFRILLGAKLLELPDYSRQRLVGIADGALGEVLTLLCEALAMSDELFAVEIGWDSDTWTWNPCGG